MYGITCRRLLPDKNFRRIILLRIIVHLNAMAAFVGVSADFFGTVASRRSARSFAHRKVMVAYGVAILAVAKSALCDRKNLIEKNIYVGYK